MRTNRRRLLLVDPLLLIPGSEWTYHREIGRPPGTTFSVDPLLLAPTASDLTGTETAIFLGRTQFSSLLSRRVAGFHHWEPATCAHWCNFIAWTHFSSFRLIDEGVPAAPQSTRQAWSQDRPRKEIVELG